MRLGLALSLATPIGSSAAFSPLSDSGLKAWYDMAMGATTGGGFITAIADQSGTGDANKNLTKAGGAGSVTYTASDAAYNNKSTLTLIGSGERFDGGLWAASLAQPFTIYAVGQATTGRIYDGVAGNRVILVNNAGPWAIYGGAGFLNAPASTAANPAKICGVYNGVSSAIYTDATFNTPAATGSIGTDTLTRLSLGDMFGGAGALNGKIAAVIVSAGAHNAALRAQYAAYLSTRFGL